MLILLLSWRLRSSLKRCIIRGGSGSEQLGVWMKERLILFFVFPVESLFSVFAVGGASLEEEKEWSIALPTGIFMTISRIRIGGQPLMNLIRLKGFPILKQLHLEEQLLRNTSDNWCIINDGTTIPNIVMGVSGKPAELLEIETVLEDRIPVIKRFTGGGTVVVDCNTIFVTFICDKDAVSGLQPYPRPIMSWSSLLYSQVFQGIGDFHLRENDYVFGDRKFGGNAQSITKKRWIHHTSFLWDFDVKNMGYLKQPKRAPEYRLAREHLEFVCCLKDFMPRLAFIEKTIEAVETHFSARSMDIEDCEASTNGKFSPSTRLVTVNELEEAAFGSQIVGSLSQPLTLE